MCVALSKKQMEYISSSVFVHAYIIHTCTHVSACMCVVKNMSVRANISRLRKKNINFKVTSMQILK